MIIQQKGIYIVLKTKYFWLDSFELKKIIDPA